MRSSSKNSISDMRNNVELTISQSEGGYDAFVVERESAKEAANSGGGCMASISDFT